MARRRTTKKKSKKAPAEGIVYIQSTFNNTIVTITDLQGNTITWASGGTVGFSGTRKSTPFAASRAAEEAAREAKKMGMERVEIRVKGAGPGREAAIRSVAAAGLDVVAIVDITPIPHNGVRPPKKRAV
ncbi:MAG: 30S ribosomal protein S11 [Thermotogae bacterium]|nr:30S ribosomal protein S11 [Thermotogota bacterium]